jgi:osmoprotectant transport system permease protein
MRYLLQYPQVVLGLAGRHLLLTLLALAVASLIALPAGWLLFRRPGLRLPVMGLFGVLYTIPSIALMILLIPLFGLGPLTVVVALVLYSQIILVRNTLAGLEGIPSAVTEAARGMGMSALQMAWRVQFPLALPVILAGLRLAAVVTVAIATIGAKFGSGGLGVLLFDGIAQGRMDKIWLGALSVGLMALVFNRGLLSLERRLNRYRSAV